MQGTIIFEDFTTLNCDMDLTTSYSTINQSMIGSYHNPHMGRQDIDIKISLPYNSITHQQIKKYFLSYNNTNNFMPSYKQTIRFCNYGNGYGDTTSNIFHGFFIKEITVSQFQHNYNSTIEIDATCDYYETDITGLDIILKRELRNKKLKRILKNE